MLRIWQIIQSSSLYKQSTAENEAAELREEMHQSISKLPLFRWLFMSKSVVFLFFATDFGVLVGFVVWIGLAGLAPRLIVSVTCEREPALKTVPFVIDWEITRPFAVFAIVFGTEGVCKESV